jgi:uncharacterized membrane protein
MTSGQSQSLRLLEASATRRVTVALVVGIVVVAAMFWFTRAVIAILVGWDVSATIYLLWAWAAVWRLDASGTRNLAASEALTGAAMELVVLAASTASLAAVGLAMLGAGHATGPMKGTLISVGVLSVVLSWAVVHTVFTQRYARAYYSPSPGGIDFNEPDPPTYRDFAYYSFTIGMTFQVSDTTITAKQVRLITLRHALLSYLFGAVILAVAINVFASLLH